MFPKTIFGIRWKENIAIAVLGCAAMRMVPDTPVPDDPSLKASLPQPTMTKVRQGPHFLLCKLGQEELIQRLQSRIGMGSVDLGPDS